MTTDIVEKMQSVSCQRQISSIYATSQNAIAIVFDDKKLGTLHG